MARKSKEYRRLSSRLTKKISKANKRYDRLKQAGWTTPAIEAMGDRRFHNLRSMSYREMQKEEKFKTSDVMGNRKTMAKYFKVYLKMREYDRVKGIGRTYQASFNAITSYFESNGTGGSVDDILDGVLDSLYVDEDTSGMSDADNLIE